jgi:hypothetical protein
VDADHVHAPLGAGWIEFIDRLRLAMNVVAALTERVRLNIIGAGIIPAAWLFNHA